MNKKIIFIGLLLFLMMISSAFAINTDVLDTYWSCDTNFNDDTANSNDLTTVGDAHISSNKSVLGGASCNFDGSGDRAYTSGDVLIDVTNDFTICGWVEKTIVGDNVAWGNGQNTPGFYAYFISSSPANTLRTQFNSGGTPRLDTTAALSANTFYFACQVHDTSLNKVTTYFDNSDTGSSTTMTSTASSTDFTIGSFATGTAALDGYLDEVSIWTVVLDSTNISELWNGGLGFNPLDNLDSEILTVEFSDAGNLTNLNNVTVIYSGTNYSNTTGNKVTINITAAGGNISQLQNFTVHSNNYFNDSITNWNLTNTYLANLTQYPYVLAKNKWNGSEINNVIVTYSGNNYTSSQSRVYIPANESAAISLFATNYISRNDTFNFTGATDINTTLAQSNLNVSIKEIYSGTQINTFNITLDNGTIYQTTNGSYTINPNSGAINLSITPLNYLSQNRTYTVSALDDKNIVFGNFSDSIITFDVIQEQNPNISLSTYSIAFNPNGTLYNFATTNFNLTIPVMNNQTYNFNFSSAGYFPRTINTTINDTNMFETVNMSLEGGVLFYFRDSVTTSLITGALTLIVENATFSQTYDFTGGSQIVTNLTENQEFNFYFYGSGYQTNTYYLTYQNQTTIDLYLINGTDNITYTVVSEASVPLQGAEIIIEKFLNGSYTQVSSQLTDVTGIAVFGLERGITHRITISQDGYISKTDTNRFSETDFTVVLKEAGEFDFDLGYQYIAVDITPTNSSLIPGIHQFTANVTSTQPILEYAYLKLYYNGTLLIQDNITSNVGGYLNFSFDLSAYNDTLINLEYGYKVQNRTEVTSGNKVYKVTDINYYSGTLLELKDRLDTSLTIGEKIALYSLVFFITLIFVSVFATGLPAVIAALALATLAGWVFGINILLLLFVTGAIVTFTMAFTGDSI